jgi:anti-sigma regulatory factor (Ser/Thr protein kinase)
MTAARRDSLVHRALVYGSDTEFLTTAVRFLRAGLAAEDVLLAIVPQRRIDTLREELGADSADVQFIEATTWYEHPIRTIAAYDEFLRSLAPRRVSALTEPFCRDRTPLEIVEWTRYEAVVNAVFGGSGASALCAYDRNAVPPDVITDLRRTHTEMIEAGTTRPSRDYIDPGRVSAACDRTPLPTPPRFESMPIESADLHDVRTFVAEQATRHGMSNGALSGLLVAVTEVATNAVRHGTPPMAVRVWADDGDLVCEVADCGFWHPAELVGFLPPESASAGGFGLWGVRMLTDLVQVRTNWDGTVDRLRSRL